jgi:hypothetical protein
VSTQQRRGEIAIRAVRHGLRFVGSYTEVTSIEARLKRRPIGRWP